MSCLEAFRKLGQIVPGACVEPLDALSIHARRPAIGLYFLPGRLKGLGGIHLLSGALPHDALLERTIYQTIPNPSFDACYERRYHTLRPNTGFHPAQIRHVMPLGFCALLSRLRHFRHCSLPVSVHRASTFLPPFPQDGFATRPSHGLHRGGTMKALTPVPLAQTKQVSPLTPPCLQDIPSPTTSYARTSLCQSPQRVRLVPGFALNEQARHAVPPNWVRFATGCPFASSCSPPRIAATQLLSTSQAVTACGGDLHPADKASSRTHSSPRRRGPTLRSCFNALK